MSPEDGGADGELSPDAIATDDIQGQLETVSADRLRDLAGAVDGVARPWWEN